MAVDVQSRVSGAPSAARVRTLLGRAARVTGADATGVSVLFCGDRRMRTLNRRYRGKDRSTDVLAFPAGDAGRGFLGDIVISVPFARAPGAAARGAAARELDRLLVHGFLHLLGYDHETDDGEMDALEARLRRRLGIADPRREDAAEEARGGRTPRRKPDTDEARIGVAEEEARGGGRRPMDADEVGGREDPRRENAAPEARRGRRPNRGRKKVAR